jgi:hypothetical protein
LNTFKRYRDILGKGFIAEMAPGIARGALSELFQQGRVGVSEATQWIESNKSLWASMSPEYQEQMRSLVKKMGRIDWLTFNWVIDGLKESSPAVASLFLGWDKGRNWLKRQVDEIKRNLTE